MTTLLTNAHSSPGRPGEQPMHFTPLKSHRFVFLDALRGIAALFVVAFHFPPAMTSSFAANGPLAVDFFFCLSGFVIAFSYERRLAEGLAFKDFFVARLIRLYPIYVIGSLLGFFVGITVIRLAFHGFTPWSTSLSLLALALFVWPTRMSPFTMTDNFPLNGPAWSLFYEIFANLAYGLLVKLRIARNGLLCCVVGASLALLISSAVKGTGLDVGPRGASFGLGFARVCFSFFLGVLIFRFYRTRGKSAETPLTRWLIPVVITLMLIAILNSPLTFMRTEVFRLVAISLCFPAMVYFGALARLPHRSNRMTTVLGELSYPLYLLHDPIVSLMSAHRVARFTAARPDVVHLLVAVTVVLLAVLAWQVGEHIDLPIRRALTRRYNAYKSTLLTPTSVPVSPKDPTRNHNTRARER